MHNNPESNNAIPKSLGYYIIYLITTTFKLRTAFATIAWPILRFPLSTFFMPFLKTLQLCFSFTISKFSRETSTAKKPSLYGDSFQITLQHDKSFLFLRSYRTNNYFLTVLTFLKHIPRSFVVSLEGQKRSQKYFKNLILSFLFLCEWKGGLKRIKCIKNISLSIILEESY